MAFAGGLVLSFLSAITINWSYSQMHGAVAEMPELSLRQPLHVIGLLLRNTAWLVSFGVESVGWLLYLAALRLSPLSLVQGVGASGIAALAIFSANGHPRRLPRREQAAVVAGVLGLLLLALSLVNTTQADSKPPVAEAVIWLGAIVAVALLLTRTHVRIARAPALGLAAGLAFAAGDILSKLGVFGGLWLIAFAPLLVVYAFGTGLLQQAFQAGGALPTAGIATLATNALPIVSGFVLFDEEVPNAESGVLQMLAFGTLIASAVLLARRRP
jgi:drug/metabolite transporter (DMT)-like permease